MALAKEHIKQSNVARFNCNVQCSDGEYLHFEWFNKDAVILERNFVNKISGT